MSNLASQPFDLPDVYLSELPTGSAKNAVEKLGKMIARGAFNETSPIPVEADLCDILGVSRTVVREATKVLSGKGMLRTARRYGTYILPFENWNLLDPDVILWHDPNSASANRIFKSSMEMRLMLEPEAARLAAETATDEQKARILQAAAHVHPEPFGLNAMMAADYTFHATILESADNLMLVQLRGMIWALLQIRYASELPTSPCKTETREHHSRVAKAISAGNADLACAQMRDMLLNLG